MRLPAIALDWRGFIASVNAAADALFDNDIKVKDRQLIVRDPDARVLLKKGIDQLRTQARLHHSFVVGAQADYRLLCEFGRSMGRHICLFVSRPRGFTQYLPRLPF
jgi:hypothetical protein